MNIQDTIKELSFNDDWIKNMSKICDDNPDLMNLGVSVDGEKKGVDIPAFSNMFQNIEGEQLKALLSPGMMSAVGDLIGNMSPEDMNTLMASAESMFPNGPPTNLVDGIRGNLNQPQAPFAFPVNMQQGIPRRRNAPRPTFKEENADNLEE